MHEWLVTWTEYTILVIDIMALIIVAFSTLEAFVSAVLMAFKVPTGRDRRMIWLRYARWLVAALTFQLAADIIETSITTGWEALLQIAVVALVRTFLNYFLDRDVSEVRERQREPADGAEVKRAEIHE
jgi:uncharacterized membrane protein